MTINENQKYEAEAQRRRQRAGRCLDGGLENAISRAGGEFHGFSIKIGSVDYLMTLRATFPSGRCVAFVGGDSLLGVITKATNMGTNDALKWRADRYAR